MNGVQVVIVSVPETARGYVIAYKGSRTTSASRVERPLTMNEHSIAYIDIAIPIPTPLSSPSQV